MKKGKSVAKNETAKIIFIPKLAPKISEQLDLNVPWASAFHTHVDQFNILVQKLPKQYSWRRTSDAGFRAEYHYVKSSYKGNDLIPILNMYYWRDFCLSIEALSVMTLWRVCDLGRAAAFAINRGDVAVASITARSALESACFLLQTSRMISNSTREMKIEEFKKNLVNSQELEDFSVKQVFASRLDPTSKNFEPVNILTVIEKISKVYQIKTDPADKALDPFPLYRYLCEVAHPNFLGRALYILSDTEIEPGGVFNTSIGLGDSIYQSEISSKAVAALSCSFAFTISSSDLIRQTLKYILVF